MGLSVGEIRRWIGKRRLVRVGLILVGYEMGEEGSKGERVGFSFGFWAWGICFLL